MAEVRDESGRAPLSGDARDLLEGLDTGDLVLFDRPCLKMGGFFGAAICAAAKVVGGVPFDHIGVVMKDEKGLNVMVEASFSGVAVRPLCERVRRSSASQICVRRLQAHRTEEMREEARRFVSEVSHLPYKEGSEGLLQMVSAAFRFHPAKEQRRRVHAETVALSASIASLEKELEVTAKPETGGDAAVRVDATKERLRRAITRRRRALVYLAAAGAAPEPSGRPAAAAAPPQPPSTPPPEEHAAAATSTTSASAAAPSDDSLPPRQAPIGPVAPHSHTPLSPSPPPPPAETFDGGLFCSELVAALYQRLGLLDAGFPARHDYVPADFAQSLGHPVDCLGAVDLDEDNGGGGSGGDDGAIGDGERSSGEGTPSRRRHPDAEEGGSSSCPAEILPPPTQIPEGGGRVALLRGAALGPGRWLRGGPPCRPSPPPSLGKGGGGGEGDVGREGGGGPSAPPAADGPPVSQSTVAAYAAAAANDDDGDAAAASVVAGGGDGDVREFVGTGQSNGERREPLLGSMLMTALRQRPQQQQQQQRDGGGGGMWWRSRLLLPQQQSLGSVSLLPGTRVRTTPGAAAAAAAAARHRTATPSSCSRWRPPLPPLGRSVGSGDGARGRGRPPTWEPTPAAAAAAAAARTAIDRVDAERRQGSSWPPSSLQPFVIVTAAAAAALAVSKKNLVKPESLSRGGGVAGLAMVLGSAWACADPLGIAGFRGT